MSRRSLNLALVAELAFAPFASPASGAELMVNGGFEESPSATETPAGWTSVGHTDGVVAYWAFGTPVYEGYVFYDFGGIGSSGGPAGDGIEQTVLTIPGQTYLLSFGLSSENIHGTSVLNVLFNGVLGGSFSQGVDNPGLFQKPFSTVSLSYLATSGSTTISFLEGVGSSGGNGANDPLIDGVSFQGPDPRSAVPETSTWLLLLVGMFAIGGSLRISHRECVSRFLSSSGDL